MSCPFEPLAAHNLRRWQESGQPRFWVESRGGSWNHHDWELLIAALEDSPFWPLDPAAVGDLLGQLQRETANFRRWKETGQAWRWVEARGGAWQHHDWLSLVDALRTSDFWPLSLDAVGRLLERLKPQAGNLKRWQDSGQPRRWVLERRGRWDHGDWLGLVDALARSEYWPLDLAGVARVLEAWKGCYERVRRWQESGEAHRWVAVHAGAWEHDDWQALLNTLRHSESWTVDPDFVARTLQETLVSYRNLQLWLDSGEARAWVAVRRGQWSADDERALVESLRRSEFWPLDTAAVYETVQSLRLEWWNLQRWRASGLARRWVLSRGGDWNSLDWLDLVAELQASSFWPLDLIALGGVLEEVRLEIEGSARSQAA